MTTTFFPQEEDWYEGDWAVDDGGFVDESAGSPLPFDVITLSAVLLIILGMVFGLSRIQAASPTLGSVTAPRPIESKETAPVPAPAAPAIDLSGAEAFVMPYDEYVLTQGPHGMSYGHAALDLASGQGEPVLSPINGRVTELYVDGIGNPTLVIENELYTITMLHGRYNVQVGQEVGAGEQVGEESNLGNTRDMAGNSCRNRDCGYHTHLNVYSKQQGQNVNPLDLLR